MNKIYFATAIHFHQPIGNFKNIFERAHSLCYKPFLELLLDYPDIKMTFHISGCLLDYLEGNHKGTLKLIRKMVSRKQIEMMTGGYYEPILAAIPQRDIKGQINMMSQYLKKRFDFKPAGMWLPERVWEPTFARILYQAGVRYIILDDTHLLRSGIKKENTHSYFLTGRGKEKIAVFPSDKMLRYTIPFKLPNETIDYFKKEAEKKKNLLFTYGDDGEKFGEWPGTHKWVHQEQWLKKFFDALLAHSDWIKLVHFSNYLKNNKPKATLEIQQGSYEELMEWSGGRWSNFLSKYPEANQMHKKMLYVSERIEKIEKEDLKQDAKKLDEAKRHLYQSQCNCAYWHGVFGGLYLYHLRSAVFSHLVTAEKLLDDILHKEKKDWLDIKNIDFYKNSKDATVIENKNFSIIIDRHEGAVIKELDYKPSGFNLINTLSRKKESYHQKILNSIPTTNHSKVATIHDDFRRVDPLLKQELVYDKFTRYCLRDYFIKKDLMLEDFINSSYEQLGDFADGAYYAKVKDDNVIFEREGKVMQIKLKLSKQITIRAKNEIEIFYKIAKKSPEKINEVAFGIEFNFTLPYLNADRYNYTDGNGKIANLNDEGCIWDALSFGISDSERGAGAILQFSKSSSNLWYFPVKTVSQSERAYELNFQSSCLFPMWGLDFDKDGVFELKISLRI